MNLAISHTVTPYNKPIEVVQRYNRIRFLSIKRQVNKDRFLRILQKIRENNK